MVAFLRFRHRQRQALTVGNIERIGYLSLFTSLVFNTLSTFYGRRMGTVNVSYGHIKQMSVFLNNGCEHRLLFTKSAPFPEMMIYSIPTQHDFTEEMTDRQLMPLATTFKFVKNRVDDLYQTILGNISSFRNAEIGHNFSFSISLE